MSAPPPRQPSHPPATDQLPQPARRRFLQVSAVGLAVANLWPEPSQGQTLPPLEDHPREFFTADEWAFVLAAVARLIPTEGDGPGAIEARVPVFIDRELAGDYGAAADWYMQGPHDASAPPELGWQSPLSPAELWRQGIAALNDWCLTEHGAPFADLAPAMQDAALTALEEEEVPLPPELRDFFETMLANTKEGYLSDPIHGGNHGMRAWVHIGFPGARAQYRDWIGRHNVPYPLGPVSISGERA